LLEWKRGIRKTIVFNTVINIELKRKVPNEEYTVRMERPWWCLVGRGISDWLDFQLRSRICK
jgi:hypothetical protein